MKLRRGGDRYIVSPLGLIWDDENYYLIAYEDKSGIRHYRVDKMKSIEVLDDSRMEESGYREFDPATYSNKVFGMYGGEQIKVTLAFPEQLIGVMLDRFGKEVSLKKEKDGRYSIRTDVVISDQFFGWLTGLGKQVQILSPESVRQKYKEFLLTIMESL
jgi:predicted DNA-binding transcriptional regulator YafY